MIASNVTAANRLAIAAAQTFAERGSGGIINTASVVALAPHYFNGTYSASKAFVLILTESLAGELAGTGVKIQAVLPGLTRTEIFDRVGGSFDNLDQNMVMGATDLVDAALAGFDQGELITHSVSRRQSALRHVRGCPRGPAAASVAQQTGCPL